MEAFRSSALIAGPLPGKEIPEYLPAAALFAAGAIAYCDPSKAPFLFFTVLGLGILLKERLLHSSKRSMVRHISDGITLSMVEFTRNQDESEAFMSALSETIRLALTNEQLTSTFKEIAIESFRNEELQKDIICTFSTAIVRASEDTPFKKVLLSAIEQGISEALSDEDFMNSMFSSLVNALVSASQNEELREAIMNTTTEAVSTAVRDERFMNELKQAMKECLRDSDIFRAGASGLIGAVLPRRSSNKALGNASSGK